MTARPFVRRGWRSENPEGFKVPDWEESLKGEQVQRVQVPPPARCPKFVAAKVRIREVKKQKVIYGIIWTTTKRHHWPHGLAFA